eukprot:2337077-Prymnesium_polylepis.1
MAMHRVRGRLRCHRRIATCDQRERDGCERDGGGPNFLCELVPGRARGGAQPNCARGSSGPRHESSSCLGCTDVRACSAPTDGGRCTLHTVRACRRRRAGAVRTVH